MKVTRLVMTSFGNQKNKIIDFSDHVNLIMGTDQNTLETVRTFLDGMLFGLSAEDMKHYRPRKLPYSGIMYLEDDSGHQLKIERNFLDNQFTVTNTDGRDVTDEYSDEYGELSILPVQDSIFSNEVFLKPDNTDRDRKRLSDLKAKKRSLLSRYNYDEMIEQRDGLIEILSEQKQLEEQIENNNSQISENESKIESINRERDTKSSQIDEQIQKLKERGNSITEEIEKLKSEINDQGAGKAQVLKRSIQGTDEQIQRLDNRIFELKEQQKKYQQKLSNLEDQFVLDRDELRRDYESFQNDIKAKAGVIPEPMVDRLGRIKIWLYLILILIGAAGIVYALYNPNDYLSRVPVFLISFFGAFIVLFSIFGIFLKTRVDENKPSKLTVPIEHIRVKEIIQKYHQETPEEFHEFYNDAKRIFIHIDNLKADISDIQKEIGESEADKEHLLQEQKETKIDLAKNRDVYKDNTIQNQIIELTKERNNIEIQIEELKEEKNKIHQDSIWKIKEETIKLEEANRKLQFDSYESSSTVDDFYNIQKKIDRYESKLSELNKQIEEVEQKLSDQKQKYILNYANPNYDDYDERMARQFNFGLQRNMKHTKNIPYITFNPLISAGGLEQSLIDKLKQFMQNKQVLVFSTELDEEEIFKTNNIKHNGIFIAASKAS